MTEGGLGSVVVAIASFKNDESVLALVERIKPILSSLAGVIVVDSIGTGTFPEKARSAGFSQDVEYHCFPENLGSAGNLHRRLTIAAATGAQYVYAVNHDGDVSIDALERLLVCASEGAGPIGAVYPLRRMTQRGDAFDVTGRRRFPFRAERISRPPDTALLPVFWSSSNGALYGLDPVRDGVVPIAELWMGYEDLAFGWSLHRAGYRQYTATSVQIDDSYEYRQTSAGYVTDKASWYSYYQVRNLLTAARLTGQPLWVRALAWVRVLAEVPVTVLLRPEKTTRLTYLAAGLGDAVRRRLGKWRLP